MNPEFLNALATHQTFTMDINRKYQRGYDLLLLSIMKNDLAMVKAIINYAEKKYPITN